MAIEIKEMQVPKYIEDLNAEYQLIGKEIIALENSLSDYKTELEQLRKKYDADTIEKKIKKNDELQRRLYRNILKAKYKYVADLIYSVLQMEMFDSYFSNKKSDQFFKWLADTYGIKYERFYNYTDFKTFYKDYINGNYKNINITANNISVEVYAEYYFRGECDDKVKLIVPMKVFNQIDNLAEEFQQYFETLAKQKEEQEKENAIKAEKREYAQFLKLKEKFDNKNLPWL